ncbi:MAG: hypothetical protein HSCHL_1502 [Hydrogenibacillus schlegelii]|uniref:Exodeoxyribonuclease VII small subunit n=1 Tax=Hydrogenibacillus schlegelii TaxID=1484 RepID=A0A2T5GC16_HYDSH|nr:MAG: hypothetical protein HSCHL_1502 [Hydrogenibacillus schlegelii]
MPLEVAIDLYREGVLLARRCDELLTAVEQKVTVLLEEAPGLWVERPFGGAER